MTEEKKPEEKKERFVVGEVATQVEAVIVDSKYNKNYTVVEFLARLGNQNQKLMKLLD